MARSGVPVSASAEKASIETSGGTNGV
jgi:hypothetical protein